MQLLISNTFSDSLARLTQTEQRITHSSAFQLQLNPTSPGLQFHRIDRCRDPNFWSIRCNRDLRIIVHKTGDTLTLCYAGHHDDAYQWAERRKLQPHPVTGAAQFVEIRETVKEITIPRYVEQEAPKSRPLSHASDELLLSYGIPTEWLEDVRTADVDRICDLCDHLPEEAAEALLNLAVGEPVAVYSTKSSPPTDEDSQAAVETKSEPTEVAATDDIATAMQHPDARRRFRVIENVEQLERALEAPWDKWTVFLHPTQDEVVRRKFFGPARVSGSAGTGKTIVALHRAVHLASTYPGARILLTTFSLTLAAALQRLLSRLVGSQSAISQQITVKSMDDVGRELYESKFGTVTLASETAVIEAISAAAAQVDGHHFTDSFLLTEWESIIDAFQLTTWDDYRDVSRLGRKTRLGAKSRAVAWKIFERVRQQLEQQSLVTMCQVFNRLAESMDDESKPYDYAIVDEAQDINVPQLRFLAALAANKPDGLFFAGDLGQRIFQSPFSWKSLGVNIQGRSSTLRINYRTSHQIRRQADKLLPSEIADVDGNTESRKGTISVFNGPAPTIRMLETAEQEAAEVGKWIAERIDAGLSAEEIGVFVRSDAELARANQAVELANQKPWELTESISEKGGHVAVCTMHLAKGLEFRCVVVMACDDDVIPLQNRIESAVHESELAEVYDTERHLLYVACTRAREQLLVCGVEPASEFLDDLNV